jgi:hypothetical protein
MIPAFELAKTVHALDRVVTVTGSWRLDKHDFITSRTFPFDFSIL